ncbi:MAG: DEAD/DEAH box helicase family protein [Roseburia sp.]|nr:DEAD/DEAH box helicase family protein [Roseburia sp.]
MSRIIIKNCNECELDIPQKYAIKLYEDMSIRHPQAFFLRQRIRDWDGKVHFLSKYGKFKIGLLPRVYKKCLEYGLKVEVIDNRRPIPLPKKPVTKIGKFKLREEQVDAINSIINNKIGDIPLQVGVIDATVNFGKSLLMSALYYTFGKKLKTLLITNDADWFRQSQEEFKEYVPDEKVTYIQGGNVKNWTGFNIGMVQSLSRNLKKYQRELEQIDMVLVDEADLAGSKTYQNVLSHLYNTRVRLGLSGTIYMSALKKDELKNWNLESFFGLRLYEFRLHESIEMGYSTNVIVKLVDTTPFYGNWTSTKTTYKEIYDDTITENRLGYYAVLSRLEQAIKQGNIPALVVCKHIAHCENLCKYLKSILDKRLNIAYVHVNTPDKQRKNIMQRFRSGDIDILVSTTIIARGKNFPKLRYMVNAAGMSSEEKTIQFLGRLVRTFKGKNKVYLDDIQYQGQYLSRHSRRRARYYKDESLKVIDLKRLWKKYSKHCPNIPF